MQRISYDLVWGQVGRDRESLVVLQECQGGIAVRALI